jgi:hypothetical protein
MSHQQTSATKRVRISTDNQSVSIHQELQPLGAAKLVLSQALASRNSYIQTFLEPLCFGLLTSRLKKVQREETEKKFEDITYMPRSLRLKTELGFSTEAKQHPEAAALQHAMKQTLDQFQLCARTHIAASAKLETKLATDNIIQQFVALLIHLATTTMIEDGLDHTSHHLQTLLMHLLNDRETCIGICPRQDAIQALATKYPEVNRQTFIPVHDDDRAAMNRLVDKLFAYVRMYVHTPWTTLNTTQETREQLKNLQLYTATQTTAATTERIAIQLETDLDLTRDTLRTIIDTEINKKTKVLVMKQKALENTIKQLTITKPKNGKPGGHTPALVKNKESVNGTTTITQNMKKSIITKGRVAATTNADKPGKKTRKQKSPVQKRSVTPTKRKNT